MADLHSLTLSNSYKYGFVFIEQFPLRERRRGTLSGTVESRWQRNEMERQSVFIRNLFRLRSSSLVTNNNKFIEIRHTHFLLLIVIINVPHLHTIHVFFCSKISNDYNKINTHTLIVCLITMLHSDLIGK